MSTLFVAEFCRAGRDADGHDTPNPQYPSLAEYTIALTASSAAGQVLNAQTTEVALCSDVACSFSVSTAGTATATNRYLPANTPIVIAVRAGQGYKIAALTNS